MNESHRVMTPSKVQQAD